MGDHAVYGLNGGAGHLMIVLYHQELSGKIKGHKQLKNIKPHLIYSSYSCWFFRLNAENYAMTYFQYHN